MSVSAQPFTSASPCSHTLQAAASQAPSKAAAAQALSKAAPSQAEVRITTCIAVGVHTHMDAFLSSMLAQLCQSVLRSLRCRRKLTVNMRLCLAAGPRLPRLPAAC